MMGAGVSVGELLQEPERGVIGSDLRGKGSQGYICPEFRDRKVRQTPGIREMRVDQPEAWQRDRSGGQKSDRDKAIVPSCEKKAEIGKGKDLQCAGDSETGCSAIASFAHEGPKTDCHKQPTEDLHVGLSDFVPKRIRREQREDDKEDGGRAS